ncbi:MAG TPA: hypothetical protein VL134_09240 [Leptolyngbya sp.]|nr:hypothetical protein [Leptolyngbya sp.]
MSHSLFESFIVYTFSTTRQILSAFTPKPLKYRMFVVLWRKLVLSERLKLILFDRIGESAAH